MFGLKIVLTVVIVAFILIFFIGQSPTVSNFLDSVTDRLNLPSFTFAQRDVEFDVSLDKYPEFNFSGKGSNLTLYGTNQTLSSLGSTEMTIRGFKGDGIVKENEITLKGSIERIELPEMTIDVGESFTMASGFSSFTASGIEIDRLTVTDTSGTLNARDMTTDFTGDITILDTLGEIEINNGLHFLGAAAKIELSNGISID